MAKLRIIDSVVIEIEQIRSSSDGAYKKNKMVADEIISDLEKKCIFYKSTICTYFFIKTSKQLISIDREDNEFRLLIHQYGLNSTENIYKFVAEEIEIKALDVGIEIQIHKLAYYDKQNIKLYLFNYNNQIYKITPKSIELVDNGTDGVLFITNSDNEPFKFIDEPSEKSLLDEKLLSQVNFVDDTLSPNQSKIILQIYLLSVFFKSIMPTKPILTVIGEKGSGKTIVLKKIGMLLFGSNFMVNTLPPKQEDFNTIITNADFVAIDNADSKCSWLNDMLAIVATGGTIEKRKLYSNNTTYKMSVKCSLAITSRTPKFTRDDVADRLLILKVKRLEGFKSEDEILEALLGNRDEIMSELIYQLQDVLKAFEEYGGTSESGQFRMADFFKFAMKIARHAGNQEEVVQIFKLLSSEQSKFTLEREDIFSLLIEWVEKNEGREIQNKELCCELSGIAESKGMDFYYKNKVDSFPNKMTQIRPNLEHYFKIESIKKGGNRTFYRFYLLDRIDNV